ncbi:hypothetical protein B0H21DRAFT_758828 [Amylocystis lapponica]|nr:hypothetical protein B0H21DRAFT_758828 [Amylocystis lapponica]
MSFLAPSQRGYDSFAHSELAQLSSSHTSNSRFQMHPLPPFDNLPAHLPAISTSPAAPPGVQHADRSPIILPKLGQTRCYWSLLTPDLHFLYLDPVYADHLHDQADLLVGKSLLSFVHPDEQASAKLDLGSVLESRTLHGSVTRVRFSRMSRVRRQLGYQGPPQEWADSDTVAVDDNYMAVDIVINWAADGLVLCFMHAVVDLSSRDNDEHNKTNWTNWCGTPYMSMDQVQLLYQRLLSAVPQPNTMSRVFQILLNQADRSLWMSWPPEREQGGPTSKDFAKLAQDVQIDSSTAGGTDAKTSCTRRYKALQVMQCGANGPKEVESIFILHGAVIFACHKVNPLPRSAMSSNNGGPHPAYSSHSYPPQAPYYDQPSHSYSVPPVPAPQSYNGSYSQVSHPSSSQYSSWSHHPESPSPQSPYGQWPSQNNSFAPPSISSVRSSSYSAPQPQHQWSSQPPSYLETSPTVSSPSFSQQLPSPNVQYSGSGSGNERTSPSPGSDIVPASRTQRRGSASTREQYGSGGRSSGNPPVGITKCSSCKVTHSPEWRKGPSGKKDLCNACGLRYARSRAKKEGGGLAQRRRKDRTLSAMSSRSDASPSASPVSASYSSLRHGSLYDDNSFASTSSAGSPSATEMCPPHPGPGFNGLTPSPSPPSGNPAYHPYSQPPSHTQPSSQNDHRSHFGTFYSVPPPPPPSVLHHMSNNHSGSNIPRLEPIVPYASRIPTLASPSSPASDSPLSGSLSTASFERERHDKDRDRVILPPTPVSAEPRHVSGKASFMTQ